MQLIRQATAAQDHRGALHVLTAAGHSWREICRIDTHPGAVRGNHYHARATELLFVLHGRIRLVVRQLGGGQIHDGELAPGDGVILSPGEPHALVALEPTELLSARTTPFTANDSDLHPFPVLAS